LRALAELSGGAQLLALADRHPDIALVGGAVRDLLLGRRPRELDVSVAAGAGDLARELAASLPPERWQDGRRAEPTVHERFGTASIAWIDGQADFAQRRSETYAHPGALPDVQPAGMEADLARRDFTVNAIALILAGAHRGRLIAHDNALEDLAAGRARVLHERSFQDDPTRLLRLARYTARLGLDIEPTTLALARTALDSGALKDISGGRIGTELWLAAREPQDGAFTVLDELGVLSALGLPSPYDRDLAQEAVALAPADADVATVRLAVLFHAPASERAAGREIMDHLEFAAEARDRVLEGAFGVDALAGALVTARRPSELRALMAARPVEACTIAGALAARRDPQAGALARSWLEQLRHVTLQIDGEDLIAAGLPAGPEIGRRLRRALDSKLDGEVDGRREEELRVALEEAP
jgi:tRNA nucleotidyltransferase (CCA-adding enzyme)